MPASRVSLLRSCHPSASSAGCCCKAGAQAAAYLEFTLTCPFCCLLPVDRCSAAATPAPHQRAAAARQGLGSSVTASQQLPSPSPFRIQGRAGGGARDSLGLLGMSTPSAEALVRVEEVARSVSASCNVA
eukprot:1159052-Pelagomonas_calceolata.AAC.15